MSDKPTIEEITSALKASGYLMEQEVATTLETEGFDVITNHAFADPEEGTSREIDVLAHRTTYQNREHRMAINVDLICECKNNQLPFVFICREKNFHDCRRIPHEILFPNATYYLPKESDNAMVPIPAFFYLRLDKYHYYYQDQLKAVQFCRILRKGKGWEANHAGIYNSIFYSIVKALEARKREVTPEFSSVDEWHQVWFFFPIVVLDGEIYSINSTSPDPKPDQVDHVTFVREVRSPSITGRYVVDFVTRQGLVDFLTDKALVLASRLAAIMDGDAQLLLKSSPLNGALRSH